MNGPKHAKPYDEWVDRLHADAIHEFIDLIGRRPKWSIGRHERPADPFFPLDREWAKP